MRTIILVSNNLTITKVIPFLPKKPEEMKVLRVTTAAHDVPDYTYVAKGKKVWEKARFPITDIDIEGKSQQELRSALKGKAILYIMGGNGFYLLNAIQKTGFSEIVRDAVDHGVIYMGASSGAYVACPTIEIHNWKKPHWNTVGLKDLTAMNLVPFLVKTHMTEEYLPEFRKLAKDSKYPVRLLTDEQFFIVRDGEVELHGRGEELRL